jgi:hypothetical protein
MLIYYTLALTSVIYIILFTFAVNVLKMHSGSAPDEILQHTHYSLTLIYNFRENQIISVINEFLFVHQIAKANGR